MLDTTPSCAVRICRAAEAGGLDISGTVIRVGGEPFTDARARILDAAKCRAVVRYSMAEVGMIGVGCPRPAFTDEVHILSDKLAIITQPRELDPGRAPIDAMLLTTLLPSCPKLMLNVEVDDYGVLGQRPCGCPLESVGLSLHLHTIRSFEKLTSEGTSFTGADLLQLIEEVLPTRFGGAPTDYQLVEEEVDGLPRVSLLVSPRIGRADPEELVAAVFETLAVGDASRPMMLEQWRGNETLQLVRRDPIETTSGKVLPLYILGPRRGGAFHG
jgi:phenylacetate-coenzyme A ligase PaaK-like adenylate-forming protein